MGEGSETQISSKEELAAVNAHTSRQSFTQSIPTYSSVSAPDSLNLSSSRVPKFSGPGNNSNSIVTPNLYAASSTGPAHALYGPALTPSQITSSYGFESATGSSSQSMPNNLQSQPSNMLIPQFASQMSDMLIESQDIDMAAFHNQAEFPFTFSNDFNPYLEYLPPDVINYFGEPSHNYGTSLISPPEGDHQQERQ
jgi:hypothetical protein